MSKICILYTGGTIGMVSTEKGYAPKKGYLKGALDRIYDMQSSLMPDWDLLEFDPLLDSSNMTAEEWTKIGKVIFERYDTYDGFVVLHGTDTMAYTASALSFMLEGLSKPVVFTGAQIPIGELRSDARDNIITAALIAAQGKCPEVSLYFRGRLLRGNRATKISADELYAFSSPNFPDLATAGIRIRYREDLIQPGEGPFSLVPFDHPIPIAVLKIFPGIHFQLFEGIMADKLKGLVLESFGAGNIPQYGRALLPIVKKAAKNGTVITVCTQCLKGAVHLGAYETSQALREAGAVSGYDMTVEAAVAKLYYLFSKKLQRTQILKCMEEELRGELTR